MSKHHPMNTYKGR